MQTYYVRVFGKYLLEKGYFDVAVVFTFFVIK